MESTDKMYEEKLKEIERELNGWKLKFKDKEKELIYAQSELWNKETENELKYTKLKHKQYSRWFGGKDVAALKL